MQALEAYIENPKDNYLHPSEVASLLQSLDENLFQYYIKRLPNEILGDVALELPDRYFGDVVESLSIDDLSEAVGELESDDQTDFIQELEDIDDQVAQAVFDKLGKNDQAEILHLKQYDDDQAGAYMQVEVFTAHDDENVHDVIRRFACLRERGELENVQRLFITQKDGKLRYSIGFDDLLVFNFKKTFKEIIEGHKENFKPKMTRDTDKICSVVNDMKDFDLSVMPVVDANGVLVGRITSDDVYDIINETATGQMYHLAGVDDHAEDDDSIIEAGKKRAFWLAINLITAIVASVVIGFFEETLQGLVALAILMPIVASMGGNAGTQSLTVVVRQLALGEITQNDAKRTIIKEVTLSLANGLLFAVVMGVIAALWFDMALLGVVIGLSMIINLLAAGFFGATIPLVLKRMNIDPAIGSTVILTTVTDVVGFVSFLGLATTILIT